MNLKNNVLTAREAKFEAQKIAFAPLFFQAIVALRDLRVIEEVKKHKKGISQKQIGKNLGLSDYAMSILAEAALVSNVFEKKEDLLFLTKIGYFLQFDELTRVNINFVNDICYKGAFHFKESLDKGEPAGLKELGKWPTIYEGLSQLTEKEKKSWFEFDHFYSDNAFPAALPIVFKSKPKRIFDIGGNTGNWTIACCKYNDEVELTILDLPGQLDVAEQNIKTAGFQDRVDYFPIDLLDKSQKIPNGADAIWMSQFLDCFSKEEVVQILENVYQGSNPNTEIFILETFWNNQDYEAAEYSVVGTSLYFTCMANGNSKMYHVNEMIEMVQMAGLKVVETQELIGNSFHTILKCIRP